MARIICENEKEMEFYTDMEMVFDALGDQAAKLEWLISDIDCAPLPSTAFEAKYVWINGKEFIELVKGRGIQFNWAVFSGFEKKVDVGEGALPYADGNELIWQSGYRNQTKSSTVEIICWDSSSVLISDRDGSYCDLFMKKFSKAMEMTF